MKKNCQNLKLFRQKNKKNKAFKRTFSYFLLFRSPSSKQNESISDQISQIESSFKSSSIQRKHLHQTI